MPRDKLRYGSLALSLGCAALLVTRAASLGCASQEVGVAPEPSPSLLPQQAAPTVDSGSTGTEPTAAAATPLVSALPGTAAPGSAPLPPNIGEWGGMSKSGRMITPQQRSAVPNQAPVPQGK